MNIIKAVSIDKKVVFIEHLKSTPGFLGAAVGFFILHMFLSCMAYADTIPRGFWKVVSVDSEETVWEDGRGVNAIDGNPSTIWHTKYYLSADPPPHEIQIDLGQIYDIEGFRYLPRQDGGVNGRIGGYEFYVSADRTYWESPVAAGVFANDAAEKEVFFVPKTGRFIRLKALSEVNGNPWTSVAEINVMGNPSSSDDAPQGVIVRPTADMILGKGDALFFAGTGIDRDGNLPARFIWHFDSGSGISDSELRDPGLIQFNIPGTFTVSLTAVDTLGVTDPTPATRVITVLDRPIGPFSPDWTEVTSSPFYPVPPPRIKNPVLTALDVTDIPANFVADPFLFYESGLWYLFMEVHAGHGYIALAKSFDGLHWMYDRIVLDLGYHLSYPYVFKHDGKYFMIPETYVLNEVRIYEAYGFPYDWRYVTTIAKGRPFTDPSVFRYNDTWWMFVSDTNNSNCYLYYSDDLLSGWVEHPKSPIVMNDSSKARPGGRPIVFDNGRIIRLAQKNDITYGEKVRAFEVDLLTRSEYAEHEIPESPILDKSGSGWNGAGMHNADCWWTGMKWLCSVDGVDSNGIWTIGMYESGYTITATAGTGGSISPSGSVTVDHGASRTFTITANTGYQIADVKVDGASVGAVGTYTFNNLTASHTISASFAVSVPNSLSVTSVSSGSINSGSSLTISHTTSGSDRLMLAGVSLRPTSNNYRVAGITYNGVVLTKVGSVVRGSAVRTEIWRLIAPPVGTYNVVIRFNQTVDRGAVAGVMTFTGVNQTAPLGTFVSETGSSGTASVNIASAAGEMVFGVVDARTSSSLMQGAAQTEHWDLTAYEGSSHGAGSTQAGATTVTTSWKLDNSADWAIAAISVKPSSASTAYSITATAGTGGSITPSGAVAVVQGANQTFAIAANTGYQIADVKVDGISVGAVSTYPFNNVTANHTIAATFAVNTSVPIAVDAVSSDSMNTGSSMTIPHTASGSNRLMLVGVSLRPRSYDYSVSSITYNGLALTKVGSVSNSSDNAKVEIWRLIAPPIGTYNVVITFDRSISKGAVAGVMTFTGVNQTAPLGTFVSATGSSGTASRSVSSAVGEMVFSVVDAKTSSSLTQGVSQTERWDLTTYEGSSHGAGSTQAGATTVTTSWKLGNPADWAIAAVPIKPAF